MRPRHEGGYGLDGMYNEDFHHSCRVALTGVREAYFSDYRGTSREWLAAAQRGFLFQGQYYPWQASRAARPRSTAPCAVRLLPREPRPGGQLARRPTADRPDERGLVARAVGVAAARPVDPDAVPGAGMGRGAHRSTTSWITARRCRRRSWRAADEFLAQFPAFAARRAVPSTAAGRACADVRGCRLDHDARGARRALDAVPGSARTAARGPQLGQHGVHVDGADLGDRTLLLRFVASDRRRTACSWSTWGRTWILPAARAPRGASQGRQWRVALEFRGARMAAAVACPRRQTVGWSPRVTPPPLFEPVERAHDTACARPS